MHRIYVQDMMREDQLKMPSNNSKYSLEFREQTARHIIESGKSATAMAEELKIDINTVCRWVRDFRKKHDLPSWHEERRRKTPTRAPKDQKDLLSQNRELAKENKRIKRELASIEEEKEILKKSLVIFAQPLA